MATKAEIKALERAAQSVREAADAFAVLGATTATSTEALKELHRALARKFHPDLCRLPDAHDLCARINVAYDTLSDPKRRKDYIRDSKVKRKVCATCAGTGHVKKQKGFKKVAVACPSCDGTGEV
jgi:DnaJ-class molecular chaperone